MSGWTDDVRRRTCRLLLLGDARNGEAVQSKDKVRFFPSVGDGHLIAARLGRRIARARSPADRGVIAPDSENASPLQLVLPPMICTVPLEENFRFPTQAQNVPRLKSRLV